MIFNQGCYDRAFYLGLQVLLHLLLCIQCFIVLFFLIRQMVELILFLRLSNGCHTTGLKFVTEHHLNLHLHHSRFVSEYHRLLLLLMLLLLLTLFCRNPSKRLTILSPSEISIEEHEPPLHLLSSQGEGFDALGRLFFGKLLSHAKKVLSNQLLKPSRGQQWSIWFF